MFHAVWHDLPALSGSLIAVYGVHVPESGTDIGITATNNVEAIFVLGNSHESN